MERCPKAALHAVVWPHSLEERTVSNDDAGVDTGRFFLAADLFADSVDQNLVKYVSALIVRCKGNVIWRVVVLRQNNQVPLTTSAQLVDHWHNCRPIGHFQRPAVAEIVLHVDDKQGAFVGSSHR